MERDSQRLCDRCGKPIPPKAKLALKDEQGKEMCLACQISDAQINKGLRH